MHPVAALTRLGGVAGHQQLLRLTTRRRLQAAVGAGQVVGLARGRYALPTADEGRQAAARVSGAASHLSAAAYWEWQTLVPPELPQVCVPRGRKIGADRRVGLELRWRPLSASELSRGVTDRLSTVLDCARDLPFGEALAVADSALRDSTITRAELDEASAGLRGPRVAAARRVLQAADGRAENAFESALRALALEAGLAAVPQLPVELPQRTVRPDLVDVARRLVVEADSWTYHAERSAFSRDMWRYNELVVEGWRVLRFTREMVTGQPARVLELLRAAAR